ncbi:MAG: PspA/IM30 family protein [Xanthomonadales bacterium]|nr:PspA/IM30 family protein [Xanthomonadales bacterium]
MALINRVSQLFRADMNAVLDHIEEPEQLLKQAVRDMEDELADCERRIEACRQEQESLESRKHEVERSASDFEQQLDLCFESGKDDLARTIIRRKLEAQRAVKHLDARMQANERFLDKELSQLEDNRTTLEGLRQKSELFVSRTPTSQSAFGAGDFEQLARELRVSDDEVEIAFLREQSSRSGS